MKKKIKEKKEKQDPIEREYNFAGTITRINEINTKQVWNGPYLGYNGKLSTLITIEGREGNRVIEFFAHIGREYVGQEVLYWEREVKSVEWTKTESIWRRLERNRTILQRIDPKNNSLPRLNAEFIESYNTRQ